MTKYKIKEQQDTNHNESIPAILVALRAQIDTTRLILESINDETEKIKITKQIEDLKIQRDNLMFTMKKARVDNCKAQNELLLKELENSNYFKNLEDSLKIKPTEVSKMTFITKPIRKQRSKLIPNKLTFVNK